MRAPHRLASIQLAVFSLAVLALAGPLHAAEPDSDLVFFETHIRPLFVQHCESCHGPDKQRGGLRLDSADAFVRGGQSGSLVNPEDPPRSLLLEAVRFESLEMPPDKPLSDREIELLQQWVERGAPWPQLDTGNLDVRRPGTITDADRAWWAFQPIDPNLRLPEVALDENDRARLATPIDRAIAVHLKQAGITPAPPADRRMLLRRLMLDVVGEPPSIEEVNAFENDPRPDAYQRWVSRLLADPRMGEKWGRKWLDLARYAESDGYKQDDYRPQAWRYRDWVIRAWNQDLPYDQFLALQVAGDELAPSNLDAMVAVSFLRHGIYEYNQRDVRTQWDIMVDDVVGTVGDAMLGMSLGCARCHDHKFDPILQADYYRIRALFSGMQPRDDLPLADSHARARYESELAAYHEAAGPILAEMQQLEEPVRQRAITSAANKFPPDIAAILQKADAERQPLERQLAALATRQMNLEVQKLDYTKTVAKENRERYAELKAELAALPVPSPVELPPAFTVTEVGEQAPPTVIKSRRGEQSIEPGFFEVFASLPAGRAAEMAQQSITHRRSAFAAWLTHPDHPLTSRVIVNRIWAEYFGQGLSSTPSDFGRLGQPPTHPSLLDYLASNVMTQGWQLKTLHREILLSSVYRQSSQHPDPSAAQQIDPANHGLWRAPVRRLTAETIRDCMLCASRELTHRSGGPGVDGKQPVRSVHVKVLRNRRDEVLDAFDWADHFNSTATRNVTTTPSQALLLLNHPWTLARAEQFAKSVRAQDVSVDAEDGQSSDALLREQIRMACERTWQRQPEPNEVDSMLRMASTLEGRDPLTAICHVLLISGELLYVD